MKMSDIGFLLKPNWTDLKIQNTQFLQFGFQQDSIAIAQ